MGEGSKGIAVSSRGSENNWLGICEAHHVDFSPEEDRGGAAGEVVEVEGGGEEGGCLEAQGPAASVRQAFPSPHPKISPEKLDLAILFLVPPAHRGAATIFLKPHPHPVA
jgi:hypothetical protein